MKRKIASTTLLAASIAVLAILGTARTVPAKSGCSNATLKGSYGLHATGTFLSGPAAGPLAIVGILTFDGAGQLTSVCRKE
jgi:type IV secretory pathway VirB2 component (pilin)